MGRTEQIEVCCLGRLDEENKPLVYNFLSILCVCMQCQKVLGYCILTASFLKIPQSFRVQFLFGTGLFSAGAGDVCE